MISSLRHTNSADTTATSSASSSSSSNSSSSTTHDAFADLFEKTLASKVATAGTAQDSNTQLPALRRAGLTDSTATSSTGSTSGTSSSSSSSSSSSGASTSSTSSASTAAATLFPKVGVTLAETTGTATDTTTATTTAATTTDTADELIAGITTTDPNAVLSAEDVFGSTPWITTAGGTGPSGDFTLNDQYFATQQTAQMVANMVGGTVVAVDTFAQTSGNPYTQNTANEMVQLSNGAVINAGLVANFFTHGYQLSTVKTMIQNEVANVTKEQKGVTTT